MAYMIAAYIVIWLAAFAFILSIVLRQVHLRREIAALEDLLDEKQAQQ